MRRFGVLVVLCTTAALTAACAPTDVVCPAMGQARGVSVRVAASLGRFAACAGMPERDMRRERVDSIATTTANTLLGLSYRQSDVGPIPALLN